VREQLQKAVDRIETIGDVHASLYRASSTGDVDFSAYLQKLCARLGTSLLDGERLRIEVQAEAVTAPLEEAVALGLIVNELVTNAVKHAYPASANGVIHVSLSKSAAGLALEVRDEGCGLGDGDRSAGIGMRLVRSLVQQCHGRLEVANDHGARFTVHLPHHGLPATETIQSQLL
jgi:two-component sensor histidine kinase